MKNVIIISRPLFNPDVNILRNNKTRSHLIFVLLTGNATLVGTLFRFSKMQERKCSEWST
jgi:hypothetical protein